MMFWLVAAILAVPAQDIRVSSEGVTPALVLPVSVERIQGLLALPAPLQQVLLRRPTFKIEVEEEHHIQKLLSNLDFKDTKVTVPKGGTYNYETQRVMMSSISTPLMQPYAAYNGGELITLAIEGLMAKYLGWRAVDSITAADRDRAATAARAEVARAIVDYCAGLPDKGSSIRMCTEGPLH